MITGSPARRPAGAPRGGWILVYEPRCTATGSEGLRLPRGGTGHLLVLIQLNRRVTGASSGQTPSCPGDGPQMPPP